MARGLSDLANLINNEFTKEGDNEVLQGLRKQIISNNKEDNKAAYDTIFARGVNISPEEFQIIKEYTVFEAQKTKKAMISTGITYMVIGIALAIMSIMIRNRFTVLGMIAAILLFGVGFVILKKAKTVY